ncbi:hypothetical protein I352_06611 [Cryptococcus deuterogattii MMRL2647]|nr:hypothetical protein I352_06611 [Cryptococcus deuterogattii MMRL2647]
MQPPPHPSSSNPQSQFPQHPQYSPQKPLSFASSQPQPQQFQAMAQQGGGGLGGASGMQTQLAARRQQQQQMMMSGGFAACGGRGGMNAGQQQMQMQMQQQGMHWTWTTRARTKGGHGKKESPNPQTQLVSRHTQHLVPPQSQEHYVRQAMAPSTDGGPEPWADGLDEIDEGERAMGRFRRRQEVLGEVFGPETSSVFLNLNLVWKTGHGELTYIGHRGDLALEKENEEM